jgi:beta-1,3-galactosyltransferase 1
VGIFSDVLVVGIFSPKVVGVVSWLKYTRRNKGVIRYAFLLGTSPEDQEIKKENSQTKDIILGNVHDAYSNLTYKTLMGFQWALTFCNQTKFS